MIKVLLDSVDKSFREKLLVMPASDGRTPLHIAEQYGTPEMVKVLLESVDKSFGEKLFRYYWKV